MNITLTQIILPYKLHINNKDTLHYLICVCNEAVAQYLFSKRMFFVLVLNCFDLIAASICFLSFNCQLFKFYFGTIAYMWKLFDTSIMYICIEIIDYEKKLYYWSSKNTSLQSILIGIINGIPSILVVMAVPSIQALTLTIDSKWKAIVVSNTLIILSIICFRFIWMFYFTHQNRDYISLGLSLNTLILEKGTDLSTFFLSQLYTNIKYGSKGMLINGYVKKNEDKSATNNIKPIYLCVILTQQLNSFST